MRDGPIRHPVAAPVNMILHCPQCGRQHVDAPSKRIGADGNVVSWDNPPHRSHLCDRCGCIWRPSDVCTNGVESIRTKGQADTLVYRPGLDLESYLHPMWRR